MKKENRPVFGRCKMLKEWEDWDSSIHEQPEQIARQGRSMTYPFTFTIDDDSKIGIFSSTSDLPYYTTALFCCACYDFQKRQLPCKHIYRLAVELGYIEIIRRPSFDSERVAQIKAAENVDEQPDQRKRMEKAMEAKCSPISIDYNSQTALFSGSGKKPYKTTPTTCTCRDYFVRRLPCKHIYRLRMELQSNCDPSIEG